MSGGVPDNGRQLVFWRCDTQYIYILCSKSNTVEP